MAGKNASFLRGGRAARGGSRALQAALLAGVVLGGCSNELNSWMDPSVVGRWEYTPTVVPILDRIDVIEEDTGEFVETSEVLPQDLIPEAAAYELSPGDQVEVQIYDFLTPNTPSVFQRILDARGNLDLPQLGQLHVAGLTVKQVEHLLVGELRDKGIIQDALVTVQTQSQQESSYSIYGNIARVGRYIVPTPDYRLIDALTEAGGVGVMVPKVYVIRRAPLSDTVKTGLGAPPEATQKPPVKPDKKTGEDLENLIDRLTKPENPGAPAVFGVAQPAPKKPDTSQGEPAKAAEPQPGETPPLIDLPPKPSQAQPEDAQAPGDGQWVFLNGKWVHVDAGGAPIEPTPGAGPAPLVNTGPKPEDLVTQRVIEIPLKPLLQGNSVYNIVIRPGDSIHVPSPVQGLVYMSGPGVARPGVYNLPSVGRLTLTKVVAAAGGLSPIGIPNRTDLTRMVGENRQATIRLNLRAIYEGSEPDLFLKPDDVINVGTTWWAQPLAIIRNGFRTTYGFGFLLDRNFGNDVFGAPPTNIGR